jgi:hypothetical protein
LAREVLVTSSDDRKISEDRREALRIAVQM